MTNLMKRILLALLAVAALASCNQPYHPEWTYNSVVYEVNVRQFSPEGTFMGVEAQLPRLKMLYISYCGVTGSEIRKIQETMPKDCVLNTTDQVLASGWRGGEKGPAIRKAFANWRKVREYRHWDDVVYD